MNDVHDLTDLTDLIAVLDERAAHGGSVAPDLSGVRSRARRKHRSRQALAATAVVTAVGLGAGALFTTRDTGRRVETADGSTTAAPTTSIVLPVPFTEVRTFPDGELTVHVTEPLPTYGPYGPDHLWHRPATCAAAVDTEFHRTEGRPGASEGTGNLEVPVVGIAGDLRAYRTTHATDMDHTTSDPSSWTITVFVPGTKSGQQLRLMRDGTAVDSTTADGPLTVLRARLDDTSTDAAFGPLVVESLDADGRPTAHTTASEIQADSVPECEAPGASVQLGPSAPPTDVATADTAVRAAVAGLRGSVGPIEAAQATKPLEVRWESPTSAWAKYQIVAFAASPETGGKDQGRLMWAQVAFDGSTWALTPEARCNYARSLGTGDTCPELPQTEPAG